MTLVVNSRQIIEARFYRRRSCEKVRASLRSKMKGIFTAKSIWQHTKLIFHCRLNMNSSSPSALTSLVVECGAPLTVLLHCYFLCGKLWAWNGSIIGRAVQMIWVMFLQSCVLFYFLPDAVIMIFFLRGGWIRLGILKPRFVQSGSAVRHLWGQNSPAMLTVPPVFALQKDPRGLSERNLMFVSVSLQSSPHYIQRSYCLLLQGPYCTFPPYASSLYSSTTDCLSALHIVISLQPQIVLHHCNTNLSWASVIMCTVRDMSQSRPKLQCQS